MKTKHSLLCLAIASTVLHSCTQNSQVLPSATVPTDSVSNSSPITVQYNKIIKKDSVSKDLLTSFQINYAESISGLNPDVGTKILTELKRQLILGSSVNPDNESTATTLEQAATEFLSESKKEYQEDMLGGGFEHSAAVEKVFDSPKLVSFEYSFYDYTGGAHGMGGSWYDHFDRNTGEIVTADAWITNMKTFQSIVAQQGNEAEQQNAKKEKYTYEPLNFGNGSDFPMPEVCPSAEGLICNYSPYAVAPYARGPVIFTISWDKLTTCVDKTKIF